MIDKVLDVLWMEIPVIVQEAVIKTNPRKRNAKRQNGCLRKPNSCEKKRSEKQRRKGKI